MFGEANWPYVNKLAEVVVPSKIGAACTYEQSFPFPTLTNQVIFHWPWDGHELEVEWVVCPVSKRKSSSCFLLAAVDDGVAFFGSGPCTSKEPRLGRIPDGGLICHSASVGSNRNPPLCLLS